MESHNWIECEMVLEGTRFYECQYTLYTLRQMVLTQGAIVVFHSHVVDNLFGSVTVEYIYITLDEFAIMIPAYDQPAAYLAEINKFISNDTA